MKIGLMGGTFNPVHLAHLRIAEEAREACGLDRVLFIPAADPPHKPLAGQVSFGQRCGMVELAIAGNPRFELSDMEGRRPGKSYSIDTILALQAEHPGDELHFIIGGDSFLEIGLWHCYGDILRSCSLIVVERPGSPIIDPPAALPVAIRSEFRYTAASRVLVHRNGTAIRILNGCPLDISSSIIRSLVEQERSITYLVPPAVEAYITEQGIYHQCR